MRAFQTILALVGIAMLSSCATVGSAPEVRINGFQMPPDVQVGILSAKSESSDKQLSIRVFWYYTRGYFKRIQSRGVSEVVAERQPLDFHTPKTLPDDTGMVGINIFVFNPEMLKYRIRKFVTTDFSQKGEVAYEGVRDSNELVLEGPTVRNSPYRINARIEVMGEDGAFVVDSVDIGDLVYTIKSSGYRSNLEERRLQ